MATPDLPHTWLRVSPAGKRSGFLSLTDGQGGVMTVTILPKMWTQNVAATRAITHEPGATSHVKAYELDFLRVESSRDAVNGILFSLAKVTDVGESQLLGACQPPEKHVSESAVVANPFAELLSLMSLADKSGVRRTDDSLTVRLEQSFTRLLVYERFLRALEPLLFRARPRYVEMTDELTSPKGRLHDKSLLLSESMGQPWVTVTFDDLTMDTPLLRVARAALHVIATDRLPRAIRSLNSQVAVRAVQFAHHLTHVAHLPREHALLVGERLWLSALERQWQPVLDTALDVLRQYGPAPVEGSDSSDSFTVHVFTEKFWEQALHESLVASFRDVRVAAAAASGEGVQSPKPWRPSPGSGPAMGNGNTYPDFMFRSGNRVVVADAKYKRTQRISAQDGYQLFAYSHLSTLDSVVSDLAALLYPGVPGAEPTQTLWFRRPDSAYTLWALRLPFPRPRDVASTEAWARYVARTAGNIRGLAGEWTTELVTASTGGR